MIFAVQWWDKKFHMRFIVHVFESVRQTHFLMNALSLSFSGSSQGFLCFPPAHNEHNFTPQRPIRDMTATCRPASQRETDRSGPGANSQAMFLVFDLIQSFKRLLTRPLLFIPSGTELLSTNREDEESSAFLSIAFRI